MEKKAIIVVLYPPGQSRHGIVGLLERKGFIVKCPHLNDASVANIQSLKPDCILTNSMTDGSCTIDLIREVRKNPDLASLPIIMTTEEGAADIAVEALKAGASLCLSAKVADEELLAQLDVQLRMWRLQQELARQLEINDYLLSKLKEDLALGQEVQQSFLPPSEMRTSNFNMKACLIPSGDLSGDYYDYRIITPDRLVVFLADVSGHGVASALLAGRLKAFFDENFRRAHRPKLFLEQLNKVVNDLGDHHHIATAVCVHIDVVDTTMVYANAGHRSLYWLDSGHNTHTLLPTTGPAIGMFEEFEISESTHGFLPGRNRLVCFTDGLVEFRQPGGKWSSEEDFRDNVILPNATKPLGSFFEELLDGSRNLAGSSGWDDDVSLVVTDF